MIDKKDRRGTFFLNIGLQPFVSSEIERLVLGRFQTLTWTLIAPDSVLLRTLTLLATISSPISDYIQLALVSQSIINFFSKNILPIVPTNVFYEDWKLCFITL